MGLLKYERLSWIYWASIPILWCSSTRTSGYSVTVVCLLMGGIDNIPSDLLFSLVDFNETEGGDFSCDVEQNVETVTALDIIPASADAPTKQAIMESPGMASTAVDFILIYAPKKWLIRRNTDESKAMVDAKILKKNKNSNDGGCMATQPITMICLSCNCRGLCLLGQFGILRP